MKVKIGNTTDEIEIGQYKPIDKGALKGYFSIVEYPSGRKITDCSHFSAGDNEWFNFPQRERKYADGRKSDYFPYITFLNREYGDQYKSAVIAAIKGSQGNNVEANTHKKQAAPLQDDTSSLWF